MFTKVPVVKFAGSCVFEMFAQLSCLWDKRLPASAVKDVISVLFFLL